MTTKEELGRILLKNNLTISVAESCTGGLISKLITDVSGSSAYFHMGLVTYSNFAKIKLLNVGEKILDQYGAVSSQCAYEMVRGLKDLSKSDICLSTTGIAGPTGGTEKKPVGLVYCGFYILDKIYIEEIFLKGNRDLIRKQTANFCLKYVIERLKNG
ncbi:MAG: CinA family protein [Proteobacteria bacterium]|nr:CinA family protein [Pseudomonadota bacterium]